MKKIINSIFVSLLVLQGIGAQTPTGVCGTSTDDQKLFLPRLEQNKINAQNMASERGAIRYVPIHFHRVGNSDQTGKIREARILEQLCTLNEDYAPLEIQFYLSAHPTLGLMNNTINNDNVYDIQSNTWLMNNKRHTKAVNIYCVNDAVSGNTPQPGTTTLAYYSTVQDWIVSRKDQISGNGNGTLAHEIGHFLSLPHTFFGWESDSFDPSDAGWPTAPLISPGGVPTEKMDGSNCTTAGDGICDTPPDYNFGIIQSGCSPYVGGAKDPMGVLVNPMENNYMSYFSACDYEFTNGQKNVMFADLNSTQRNYLDNNFVPAATTITSPSDLLISPIGSDTADFYDVVELKWNTVPGATHYLLEVDLTAAYSTVDYQAFILTSTSKTLDNLKKSRTYYWRVKPFNEAFTCADYKASSFKTPALSNTGKEIASVQEWNIQPNPTSAASNARIFVNSDRAFEGNVQVFDAAGKMVYNGGKQFFPQGETYADLAIENLANGIYFVSLISGDARMTQKLVVLN